jgi:acetylornithine/succinyldiaminopimelate/putrescine aminotransferase
VGDATCAVLVEPVQGEGGVVPAEGDYLRALAELCGARNVLLILDEVQTGIGRTGAMFAFQRYGVRPDVVTLAKGLGGGVPVGAVLARDEIAKYFQPGDHGTTFGGNPLSSAAVCAVLETIASDGLVANAAVVGERLMRGLERLAGEHDVIEHVRGVALLVACDLRVEAGPVVEACMRRGLLVNAVRPRTLRFAPPLVVREAEVDQALAILDEVLEEQPAVIR